MTRAAKVAIVTGAGSGIGRATALRFAQCGAHVAVVDRDEAAGSATAQQVAQAGGSAHFICADVAHEQGVQAYVSQTRERFGRIDCLFNNAGIEGPFQPTWQYDVSAFERVMAVNVTSIFLGMRHVLPIMIAQRYGRIVNASSVAGLAASPGMIGYVASKHAVIGLTKTAAVEAGQYGVRVNAICPGAVDTEMMRRIGEMWKAGKAPMGAPQRNVSGTAQ